MRAKDGSFWDRFEDFTGPFSFERLVTANVRVPDLTIGDFNAQFAANAIGVLRVKQLCERYGVDKVEAAMMEMQNYSERRVRSAIAQAPSDPPANATNDTASSAASQEAEAKDVRREVPIVAYTYSASGASARV